MAGYTLRGKTICVPGVGGILEILLVARVAEGRRAGKCRCRMALCTGYGAVGSREGKGSSGVVESPSPLHVIDPVTLGAVSAETCSQMVRRLRSLVVGGMTGITVGRYSDIRMLLLVRVARLTWSRAVGPHKRKTRGRMSARHVGYKPGGG